MSAPLVSVLTPSLNQGRWLADNLASVARQTYARVEHVVVDGGSTDESLENLAAASPAVRWTSGPDGGQADALNKAFAASRGEIIGWLNADDGYADRRAVQWAVEAFEANPSVDVVYGHALLLNESNVVLRVLAVPRFDRRRLRAVNYIIQPAVFIRRRRIEAEPRFLDPRLQFVMDRELWFRLAGSSFLRLDRVLAYDRHQRTRKVLQPPFPAELSSLDAQLEEARRFAWLDAAHVRAQMRLGGLLTVLRLSSLLLPPVQLSLPPAWRRLAWQAATPRSRFPFATAHAEGSDRA